MSTVLSPEKPHKIDLRGGRDGTIDTSTGDYKNITKSDETSLERLTRGLYVGRPGNVTVLSEMGETVLWESVSAGSLMPIRCTKVFATGTTAGAFVACW